MLLEMGSHQQKMCVWPKVRVTCNLTEIKVAVLAWWVGLIAVEVIYEWKVSVVSD